jgi:undecaprenyl-diphosphatase
VTVSQGADAAIGAALAVRARTIVDNARGAMQRLLATPAVPASRLVVMRQRYRVLAIAAGVMVVFCMIFVDQWAYRFALALPMWLVDVFFAITDFGRSGWILVPTGGVLFLIALAASSPLDQMTRGVLAALTIRIGFIFVAVGLPGAVFAIVKRWIGRVRPSDLGPFAYEPFSWRPQYASLPSGHTLTAFAALAAIGALFPRARPFLWAYALVIAVSRIAVTAHWSSDVIAGAAIGTLCALLVRDWFAQRRLGFAIGPDGEVRVLAGPSPDRIKKVARALIGP